MAKKESANVSGADYVSLLEDHFELLRHAYESFLIWECFNELLFRLRASDPQYPRVHFFSPLIAATVSAAFDSFVINLYKFYDKQSHKLETLVDVGVKRAAIPPCLETHIRDKIRSSGAGAASKNIRSLRNRTVGHYRVSNDERSPLTAVDPTPHELREHFGRIAEILELCTAHGRFSGSSRPYNGSERQITDTAGMVMRYFRGEKAP